jgi:hypothetical protein
MRVESRSWPANEHRGVPPRCNVRLRFRTLDVARRCRQCLSKPKKLHFDEKVVTLVTSVQTREPDVSGNREALQRIVRVADEKAAIRDEGAKNSCVKLI